MTTKTRHAGQTCQWTQDPEMDPLPPGFEPQRCTAPATHTTCDPTGGVVCEKHVCRCSRPLEDLPTPPRVPGYCPVCDVSEKYVCDTDARMVQCSDEGCPLGGSVWFSTEIWDAMRARVGQLRGKLAQGGAKRVDLEEKLAKAEQRVRDLETQVFTEGNARIAAQLEAGVYHERAVSHAKMIDELRAENKRLKAESKYDHSLDGHEAGKCAKFLMSRDAVCTCKAAEKLPCPSCAVVGAHAKDCQYADKAPKATRELPLVSTPPDPGFCLCGALRLGYVGYWSLHQGKYHAADECSDTHPQKRRASQRAEPKAPMNVSDEKSRSAK